MKARRVMLNILLVLQELKAARMLSTLLLPLTAPPQCSLREREKDNMVNNILFEQLLFCTKVLATQNGNTL